METEASMIRYWAMTLLMFFNLFWTYVSVTTAIDLTLIGHLRGWKKIRYAKWLGGFIEEKKKGHEMLADCTTHPQVLTRLFVCLGALCSFIALTVCAWFIVNDIEPVLLLIIDAVLYAPTVAWLVVSRVKTKKEYEQFCQSQ